MWPYILYDVAVSLQCEPFLEKLKFNLQFSLFGIIMNQKLICLRTFSIGPSNIKSHRNSSSSQLETKFGVCRHKKFILDLRFSHQWLWRACYLSLGLHFDPKGAGTRFLWSVDQFLPGYRFPLATFLFLGFLLETKWRRMYSAPKRR
jgi:hypothetical protein